MGGRPIDEMFPQSNQHSPGKPRRASVVNTPKMHHAARNTGRFCQERDESRGMMNMRVDDIVTAIPEKFQKPGDKARAAERQKMHLAAQTPGHLVQRSRQSRQTTKMSFQGKLWMTRAKISH
jgi:hypothetical protein